MNLKQMMWCELCFGNYQTKFCSLEKVNLVNNQFRQGQGQYQNQNSYNNNNFQKV